MIDLFEFTMAKFDSFRITIKETFYEVTYATFIYK